MSTAEAELAVLSFFLYMREYNPDAISLPKWFIEARLILGKDKTEELSKQIYVKN